MTIKSSIWHLGARQTRLLLIGAVALLWPLVSPNPYWVSMGSTFFINLLLIASLNLLVGLTGLTSLAHAAFWGIGAYTSGMLSVHAGVSPWLGTLGAIGASAVFSVLIGWPTLRLSGHYLAMATLGFNAIFSVMLTGLVKWTGGPNGLINIPAYSLAGFELSNPVGLFFLFGAVTVLILLSLSFLEQSRAGRALRVIHASDTAAACMGIAVSHYKLGAFVLANAIASLAGAMAAHQNQFISPDAFSFSTSILLLVMVAIGGFGRYWGPFFGALIFTALPELTRSLHDAELLIFGIAMIVVVGFMPGGIAGGLANMASRHTQLRRPSA